MTDDVRITIDDLRTVGICRKAKPWLEKHGIPFDELRPKNGGIPVSKLYALNDQRAQIERLEVAAHARIEKDRE